MVVGTSESILGQAESLRTDRAVQQQKYSRWGKLAQVEGKKEVDKGVSLFLESLKVEFHSKQHVDRLV